MITVLESIGACSESLGGSVVITASALERVFICRASALLPQRNVAGPWAQRGIAIAKYRELRGDGLTEAQALHEIQPVYHQDCSDLVLGDTPPHAQHEVAYAYDVETGQARELEGCQARNYGSYNLKPTEICGTADAVWTAGDGTIIVNDDKSGKGKTAKPATSATMMFYGLCAWLVAGGEGGTVVRLRYHNIDTGYDLESDIDMFDLVDFQVQLKKLVEDIADYRATPTRFARPVEGEHCRYCPAQESCPVKVQLMRRIESGDMDQEIELSWAGGMTAETAAEKYQLWRSMVMLTKRAGDIMYAYAKDHTIDLGDGRAFGAHEKLGNEKLDGDVAYELLGQMFGQECADAAVTRSVSKKRLKAALKAAVPKGKAAGAERDALKAIREAGGSQRPVRTKVEVYTEQRHQVYTAYTRRLTE